MRQIKAIEILRQVWLQQFYVEKGSVQLRSPNNCPPIPLVIRSPYDPEARYGNKRTQTWTGYKVHLSETCDADAPHLITHVETTPTTTKDHQVTEPVHQALESQELLPLGKFLTIPDNRGQNCRANVSGLSQKFG